MPDIFIGPTSGKNTHVWRLLEDLWDHLHNASAMVNHLYTFSSAGERCGRKASTVLVRVQFLLLMFPSSSIIGLVCTSERIALKHTSARSAWRTGIRTPDACLGPILFVYHSIALVELVCTCKRLVRGIGTTGEE